jgi:hypothetical protein
MFPVPECSLELRDLYLALLVQLPLQRQFPSYSNVEFHD